MSRASRGAGLPIRGGDWIAVRTAGRVRAVLRRPGTEARAAQSASDISR
ncbi:hypothetical protein [Dactylosporangium sp. NPDC051541]